MSKVQFQIGTQNHVRISLPSRMIGDSDMFVGKAAVRVASLSCSQKIKIDRARLTSFFAEVENVYRTLKGEFSFSSLFGTFSLSGKVTSKGLVRLEIKIGYPPAVGDDYTAWQTEVAFNCYPEDLKSILDARAVI